MSNKLNGLYVGGLVNRDGIDTFSIAYYKYGELGFSGRYILAKEKVTYIDKDYVLSRMIYSDTVVIVLNKYFRQVE